MGCCEWKQGMYYSIIQNLRAGPVDMKLALPSLLSLSFSSTLSIYHTPHLESSLGLTTLHCTLRRHMAGVGSKEAANAF
jgi:hypothetical protein